MGSAGDSHDQGPHGSRRVRTQRLQHGRGVESAIAVHGHQPDCDPGSHRPVGRIRRAAFAFGHFGGRRAAVGQMVGDGQVGGGPDRLADPVAEQHVGHLLGDISVVGATRFVCHMDLLAGWDESEAFVDSGVVQPTRTFNVPSPRRVLFSASSDSSSSNRSTRGTSASSSARELGPLADLLEIVGLTTPSCEPAEAGWART